VRGARESASETRDQNHRKQVHAGDDQAEIQQHGLYVPDTGVAVKQCRHSYDGQWGRSGGSQLASARAVSTPIPDEPPVTIVRLPERSIPVITSVAVDSNPNGVLSGVWAVVSVMR
jgi:hypothetical protein